MAIGEPDLNSEETVDAGALDPLCLYNHPAFSALNIDGAQRYHRIPFHAEGRLIGALAGVIDGPVFTSGYSAGFGGPDLLRTGERLDLILAMIDHCLDRLRQAGIRQVRIRSKPFHYSESEAFLQFALLRAGFTVASADVNFFIDLRHLGSPEAYLAALKSSARRALRHALKEPYGWTEAETETEWRAGYDLLAENRRRNAATLSLSYDYVRRLKATFGPRIQLYLLRHGEALIAASLLYRITPRGGQVMYWGDCGDEHVKSPMNLVAFRMVETAMAQGMATLDLGTSTSSGHANFGVIAFKLNVLATAEIRYSLILDLS